MKSLKKSVIAVVFIGALSVAGMAFAYHGQDGRQNGPMGSFGGPRYMGMQQWYGNSMPPAPQMEPETPCFRGQRGPMFGQQHMWGRNFCGQRFGHRGGTAFGNPGWQGHRMEQFRSCAHFAPSMPQGFCGQGFGHGRGPAFGPKGLGPRGEQFPHFGHFSPDMPQQIRAKVIEAAKLRIDLEDVLSQKPLNRDKAIELNRKIGQLKQEIRAWCFERRLNRIEEWNKKPTEDAEEAEPTKGK